MALGTELPSCDSGSRCRTIKTQPFRAHSRNRTGDLPLSRRVLLPTELCWLVWNNHSTIFETCFLKLSKSVITRTQDDNDKMSGSFRGTNPVTRVLRKSLQDWISRRFYSWEGSHFLLAPIYKNYIKIFRNCQISAIFTLEALLVPTLMIRILIPIFRGMGM